MPDLPGPNMSFNFFVDTWYVIKYPGRSRPTLMVFICDLYIRKYFKNYNIYICQISQNPDFSQIAYREKLDYFFVYSWDE